MSPYRVSANIVFRNTSPTLVMAFDRVKGVMYEFNETAGRVLQFVDGQRSVSDILSLLAEEHEIGPEEEAAIRQDVEEIIGRFVSVGIIERFDVSVPIPPTTGEEDA